MRQQSAWMWAYILSVLVALFSLPYTFVHFLPQTETAGLLGMAFLVFLISIPGFTYIPWILGLLVAALAFAVVRMIRAGVRLPLLIVPIGVLAGGVGLVAYLIKVSI